MDILEFAKLPEAPSVADSVPISGVKSAFAPLAPSVPAVLEFAVPPLEPLDPETPFAVIVPLPAKVEQQIIATFELSPPFPPEPPEVFPFPPAPPAIPVPAEIVPFNVNVPLTRKGYPSNVSVTPLLIVTVENSTGETSVVLEEIVVVPRLPDPNKDCECVVTLPFKSLKNPW